MTAQSRGGPVVREVMSIPPIVVAMGETLDRAFGRMCQERVTALPVGDSGGRPVGLLALGHFERAVPEVGRWPLALRLHSEVTGSPSRGWESEFEPLLQRLRQHRVQEVMDSPGPHLDPGMTLLDAIDRENGAGVNVLAVVEDGRIIGSARLEVLLGFLRFDRPPRPG